jgi:hypothetical protein
MRGQAFVVFKEVGEATAAKNNLSGYPIFGKPMVDIDLLLENSVRGQEELDRDLRGEMIVPVVELVDLLGYAKIGWILCCSWI